jgi:hypothetical protein
MQLTLIVRTPLLLGEKACKDARLASEPGGTDIAQCAATLMADTTRPSRGARNETRVRLIRNVNWVVNQVDLTKHQPGDVLTLSTGEASVLVNEGWAEPADDAPK